MDMKDYGLYESASVKIQTLKTAIEVRRTALSTSHSTDCVGCCGPQFRPPVCCFA